METINRYLFDALIRHADRPMQIGRQRSWTYAEAGCEINGAARALRKLGVGPGDKVALIAENSPRWLHAYMGTLACGAVVVPRGEEIVDGELRYILEHSEAKAAFAGSAGIAARLPGSLPTIRLDDFPGPLDTDEDALRAYAGAASETDLAVILYTSGTTGRPKGVMLEHRNIAHNIRNLPPVVKMHAGDKWVSVLPAWHTFEQTVELCGFSIGCVTIYSDKRRLRDDLREHRPDFFASVPRIWETIYRGARGAIEKQGTVVRVLFGMTYRGSALWRRGNPLGWPLHWLGKKLFYDRVCRATGGRLKYAVSGGGCLPAHIDKFFDRVGITLIVGYGLTETAPVVAMRRPEDNVLGTIGRALPDTEIRISEAGTVQVRGPQVMRGYYKDEELTRRVLDSEGWFDTGDLGRLTEKGDLVFVGRAKETIVLSGGENVEPEPIENKLLRSELIFQVMLVGQDRKNLAALVVPNSELKPTGEQIRAHVRQATGPSGGFRSFEAVHKVAILDEPLSVENGLLTPTMKMRRNVIAERYKDRIDALYN